MKLPGSKAAAMTLVEVMVTVAVISVAGLGAFEMLRTGMILFGKNTAINLSHSESRFSLLELQQELSASASTPELTSSSGAVLSGTAPGPAAGVYFQSYAGGPYSLAVTSGSIPASATSIQVTTGTNFKPLPGMTIHIQALPLSTNSSTSLVELLLSGSSAYSSSGSGSATTYTPTISGSVGSIIYLRDQHSGSALTVACFFTAPIIYVVQNGQMVRQSLDPAGSGKMLSTVLAYNVSSAAPFSMPTVNNSPGNTFVQVQNFTAFDPSSSNRGYHAVITPLTVQVSHYAQLTTLY